MSTVREEYGLACPNCHDDQRIQILVETMVDLSSDGTIEARDSIHEWRDGNYCTCRSCGYEGTVVDFAVRNGGAS